jgi:hypothetical protein
MIFQSGRGLPHSKTLARGLKQSAARFAHSSEDEDDDENEDDLLRCYWFT